MAQIEEIIVEVKVDAGDTAKRLADVKQRMNELKSERKALNDAIKESGTVEAEQAQRLAEIQGELKSLTAEEKMYTAQLNISTQGNKTYGDSLVEMSAQLAKLKSEYRGMTKEQRESAAGKELQKSIQDLDKALKEADSSIGDHQRNVGNYSSALLGLNGRVIQVAELFKGGFRAAITAAGQSLTSLGKTLLTTPWGWVVTAIAAVTVAFKNMGEAIKRSDDLSTQLQRDLAGWEALKTRFSSGWSNFTASIMKGLVGLSDGFGYAEAKIKDFFSATELNARGEGQNVENWKKNGNELINLWDDLIVKEDELQEARRQFAVDEASRESLISELKVKVADAENYSAAERKEALDRIIRAEENNFTERKRIAEQNYKNLKMRAALEVNTTDEMKDKVNSAYVEMIKANTEYNNSIIRATRQRANFAKQEAAEEERQRQERQRKWQEAQQKRQEAAQKELEELRKLEDMYTAFIVDAYERQRKQINLLYDRQIDDIKKRLETEKNMTLKTIEALNKQIELLEKNKAAEITKINKQEIEQRKKDEDDMAKWEENNFAEALKHVAELGEQMADEARAKYELSRTQYENSVQERLNAVYSSVTEAAAIELEQAENFYKSLVDMDAVTRAAIYGEGKQAEEEYKRAIIEAEAEILAARQRNAEAQQQLISNTVSAVQTMTSALDKLYEAAAGDSEQYEKFKKAIAIVDATLSMAQAIASAIATSTAGDPYTVALRVATAVAEVTAQFAVVISTLKSVNIPSAGSYSAGGIVPGDSYSGDKLTAAVNSGEMILNKSQQQELFRLLVAGAPQRTTDYERIADIVRIAAKNMPPPVLDYRELTMFGKKVSLMERKLNN